MIKLCYLLIFSVFLTLNCSSTGSQNEKCQSYFDNSIKQYVFTNVEIKASLPGGNEEFIELFYKFFSYPDQDSYQGKVILELVISSEGKIIKSLIFNKIINDYTPVEKEAIKALENFPDWNPAICNGKKVTSKIFFPVFISRE